MTLAAQKILEEIKSLKPIERVELIDGIYRTFEAESDLEVEKAWAVEAERRLALHRGGDDASISEKEMFDQIDKDHNK